MKKIFLILVLVPFFVLVLSCSKDDGGGKLDTSSFVGKWTAYGVEYRCSEGSDYDEVDGDFNFQFTATKVKLVLVGEISWGPTEHITSYSSKDESTVEFNYTDSYGEKVPGYAKLADGKLVVIEQRGSGIEAEQYLYYCTKVSDTPDSF